MLKDITGIKILGANFDSLTVFNFFNPHDNPHDRDKIKTIKGTLLYGRNGSGKSTIARAFRKLAGEIVPVITNAELYDDENKPISLTEEEKKHMFIFDEDYIDKNVKLQQDHLETIVILGPAADLTEKLKEAVHARDTAKEAYEQQCEIYKEYCDESSATSPQYYIESLKKALRGDDNWSGRDREIHNNRQNAVVKDNTYKNFVGLTPSKSKTELIGDYNEKMKELEVVKTGASMIDTNVPTISNDYRAYDDETVQQLLAMKIEKPELSERERELFILVQEGEADDLLQRLTIFREKETIQCPYCFQKVTAEYKSDLVKSIEKVLSKVVEEHQKVLENHVIEPIGIDLKVYEKLRNYQTCIDLIKKIDIAIQANNDNLKKKKLNPYQPIVVKITTIKAMIVQLITALEELEKARTEYNKEAEETGPIITELDHINREIAYYDVKELSVQLDKQNKKYAEVEKLCRERKTAYCDKEKAITALESRRKNMRLALEDINACMQYIFFANNRLKIEYVDGEYKLLSHGKSVKPCDVSVGERNIIGLSYFFTSILENHEEKSAYGEEYLLVIDDPVSSYDAENRIGILSFLKYKLGVFLEENTNTKALVMTHDLMAFYDIHKVFEEIVDVCKKKWHSNKLKFNCFEIRDGSIKPFSYKNRQEYTEIIQNIYIYASGQTNNYELVIGNLMRQALEAFSTFEYKKGIEEVSTDEQILSQLSEPEYVPYYKNLMYRLVLHGGSHKEEQIKTMKDFQFFSLISESEKKRTARDVLCFIYLLNQRHLLEHLKKCGNVKTNLESWCQDIKSRAEII